MDALVAVRVTLQNGGTRFFLTWGRIQHAVDPDPLCALVLRHSRSVALGDEPAGAELCDNLRQAAASADAPYFYECYFQFAQRPIPLGEGYEQWRRLRAQAMENGREIAYCGAP